MSPELDSLLVLTLRLLLSGFFIYGVVGTGVVVVILWKYLPQAGKNLIHFSIMLAMYLKVNEIMLASYRYALPPQALWFMSFLTQNGSEIFLVLSVFYMIFELWEDARKL